MEIDRKLNLVIPVETEKGLLHVHSMPFSEAAFKQNWLILAKVLNAIHAEGFNEMMGPRVAAHIMEKLAVENGTWEGPIGVEATVMNEIRRTSAVILPDFTTMTLHDAVAKKVFTESDKDEVENAIVFFIVVSALHKRNVLRAMVDGMCLMWGAQTTSLTSTAFANSLRTSTPPASSGVRVVG